MAPEHSPSKMREMRVFISSTFRDMQQEREELNKRIVPRIRKICEERRVSFADVDLRWGITDEEKSEGKVLPICLQEIENCRPFFIGIPGERYGWVPYDIAPDLVQKEPWLASHQHASVTELEILHGVLNPAGTGKIARAWLKRWVKKLLFAIISETTIDHCPVYGMRKSSGVNCVTKSNQLVRHMRFLYVGNHPKK